VKSLVKALLDTGNVLKLDMESLLQETLDIKCAWSTELQWLMSTWMNRKLFEN
jgi:hypothetical protein